MNNHKSIESYLKSARKYKSPISNEKVRTLIESEKNIPLSNFKNKRKGAIIMTLSVLLITGIILINSIFQENDKSQDKNENVIEQLNEKQELTSSNSIEKNSEKEKEDIGATLNKENYYQDDFELNSNRNVFGANKIVLSEDYLKVFGLQIDSLEEEGKFIYGIAYNEKIGPKAAIYSIYTLNNGSNHKFYEIKPEDSSKFSNFRPSVMTNYEGTVYFSISNIIGDSEALIEFFPFYDEFKTFYEFQFDNSVKDAILPDSINIKLNMLEDNLKDYCDFNFIKNDDNRAQEVKRIFIDLNQYFGKLPKKDLSSKSFLSDSNNTTVFFYQTENDFDSLNNSQQEHLKDIDVNTVYLKNPVYIRDFLKRNNSNLLMSLDKINKLLQNHSLNKNMIPIEIPIKNNKNDGFILWFYPSQSLIDLLPQKYSNQLAKEFNLLEREEAICGADINPKEALLDIWRSCSGAIENLRVFPNPVENNLIIKFSLKEKRNLQISIHSLEGINILNLKSSNYSEGEITETLNLSKLNKGIYFVVVKSDRGEVTMQRIIKS